MQKDKTSEANQSHSVSLGSGAWLHLTLLPAGFECVGSGVCSALMVVLQYVGGINKRLTATVPPPLARIRLSSPGAGTAVARPQPSEQTCSLHKGV